MCCTFSSDFSMQEIKLHPRQGSTLIANPVSGDSFLQQVKPLNLITWVNWGSEFAGRVKGEGFFFPPGWISSRTGKQHPHSTVIIRTSTFVVIWFCFIATSKVHIVSVAWFWSIITKLKEFSLENKLDFWAIRFLLTVKHSFHTKFKMTLILVANHFILLFWMYRIKGKNHSHRD